MVLIQKFLRDETGTTITEYGLIISLMSLAIIGAGNMVWTAIEDKFMFLGTKVRDGA